MKNQWYIKVTFALAESTITLIMSESKDLENSVVEIDDDTAKFVVS